MRSSLTRGHGNRSLAHLLSMVVLRYFLVMALYHTGVGYERIVDALIGGFLAIVFAVLLFPADPLKVLRRARMRRERVFRTSRGLRCGTSCRSPFRD